MRNVIVVTSLLVATAAHAQPAELTATAAPAPRSTPTGYLETGAMAGGNGDLLTLAATFDAGYHLDRTPLWIHARVATGTGDKLFAEGTGSLLQVRAGIESRGCVFDGMLCAMAGVDLGYQRTTWRGRDEPPFVVGNDTGTVTTTEMSTIIDRAIAVPRLGLDIGGAVRVRPSVELDVGSAGVDGANATLALAFQW